MHYTLQVPALSLSLSLSYGCLFQVLNLNLKTPNLSCKFFKGKDLVRKLASNPAPTESLLSKLRVALQVALQVASRIVKHIPFGTNITHFTFAQRPTRGVLRQQ